MSGQTPVPFDDVLRAAAALQRLIPEATLVGGSAAALFAGHRRSEDADHIVADLRSRFDDLLTLLEQREDWTTARAQRPVLILGSLQNVETGLRQLRRRRPIETTTVETAFGTIRVPTPAELLRVKGWLILDRNMTRDYLDFLAIADKLGADEAIAALRDLDSYYADAYKPGERDVSPLVQLTRQLADIRPEDRDDVDLATYRGLKAPWTEWSFLQQLGTRLATAMISDALRRQTPERAPKP